MKRCRKKYYENDIRKRCIGTIRRIRKTSWRKGATFCLECIQRKRYELLK